MLETYIIEHETLVRLVSFLSVFIAMLVWEVFAPRRVRVYPIAVRWLNNLAINLLNVFIVRVLMPIAVVGIALTAEQHGLGLFNIVVIANWLKLFLAIVLMDLALYLQHLVFHHVEYLWRLHRMHHADLDFDVTTGIRFHPLEIILSLLIKIIVVLLLGVPVVAVVLFEIILNITSLFNHANIAMPKKIDRLLRYIIVTPDMHRVHHSVIKTETNSNFGFNLPFWDYIFHTYQAQPSVGHQKMTIGLEYFRDKRELWLDRLLLQPFKK